MSHDWYGPYQDMVEAEHSACTEEAVQKDSGLLMKGLLVEPRALVSIADSDAAIDSAGTRAASSVMRQGDVRWQYAADGDRSADREWQLACTEQMCHRANMDHKDQILADLMLLVPGTERMAGLHLEPSGRSTVACRCDALASD